MSSTLILGGVRSGKSRLAEQLAINSHYSVTYIATATADDTEMQSRIDSHKQRRPAHWSLIEEPLLLAEVLTNNDAPEHCFLVDCLTLWLSNALFTYPKQFSTQKQALLKCLPTLQSQVIFVSNETNMGVTPLGEVSRQFCDEAGLLHQHIAEQCDKVILTVAGLPHYLKGKAK